MRLVTNASARVTASGKPNITMRSVGRLRTATRTFRNSRDNQSDGNDQVIHERQSILLWSSTEERYISYNSLFRKEKNTPRRVTSAELYEKLDHQH